MLRRLRYAFKRLWLDIRAGRCSGFRPCCIVFYATAWRPFYGDSTKSLYEKPAWKAHLILRYHELARSAGYVPCPLCLMSGARVKVMRCTAACGHIKESRRLILELRPGAFDDDR